MPPTGLLRKGLGQINIDTTVDMLKIRPLKAGIAQLVEHDLAKVGVASSSLVSRSKFLYSIKSPAGWQNGYAAVCKTVDVGSIPAPASISTL